MAYNVNPEQQVVLADIVTVVLPAYRLRNWPRLYRVYTVQYSNQKLVSSTAKPLCPLRSRHYYHSVRE